MRNKGQGLIVSAVIAAGLLLRTGGAIAPGPSDSSNAGITATPAATPDLGEGPWIASCKYWAAVSEPSQVSSRRPAEVHNTFDIKNSGIDFHVNLQGTSSEQESECGAETKKRWGFPHGGPVNVTAIIATVPDPVHSHLALMFDRTISAILQAAADNGYVSSYYWLPWKTRNSGGRTGESLGEVEPNHDAARERLPGLVVLKHVPEQPEGALEDSFYKVVYLFLVAETPTRGLDSSQLKNALLLETELESALEGTGTFQRGAGRVAIVGPMYSGSAASLSAGIDAARSKNPSLPSFEVSGTTSTQRAAEELQKDGFASFGDHTGYEMDTLFRDFGDSGYDLKRVVLLIEDSTTYGSLASSLALSKKARWKISDVQVIRFPRDISLLRNAQVAGQRSNNDAPADNSAPNPFLRMTLKDSGEQDNVPKFSTEHTPVSLEAELTTIGRLLHRNRSQYIAMVASNPLDQIFLAQFLHRACPDARLVFFGGDLLLVREIENVPFIGSITVSPYSLMGLGRIGRAYPDSSSLAEYNAASYTFWHNKLGNVKGGKPELVLQSYHNPLAPDDVQQPPLWATVLGSDGYYPLAIIKPCSSDQERFLGRIAGDEIKKASCAAPPITQQKSLSMLSIYPSLLWDALCVLVCLLCLSHTLMLVVASYWSLFTRDLAIGNNDQPPRRSTYVNIASAALVSMVIAVSFPAISLASRTTFSPAGKILAIVALSLAAVVLMVTIWKTGKLIGWQTAGQGATRLWRAYDRGLKNAYPLLNALTLTGRPFRAAVVGPMLNRVGRRSKESGARRPCVQLSLHPPGQWCLADYTGAAVAPRLVPLGFLPNLASAFFRRRAAAGSSKSCRWTITVLCIGRLPGRPRPLARVVVQRHQLPDDYPREPLPLLDVSGVAWKIRCGHDRCRGHCRFRRRGGFVLAIHPDR